LLANEIAGEWYFVLLTCC